MKQYKPVITPEKRLEIASQQMAGMQSAGYLPKTETIQRFAATALACADELIHQSGCRLEDESPDAETVGDCKY